MNNDFHNNKIINKNTFMHLNLLAGNQPSDATARDMFASRKICSKKLGLFAVKRRCVSLVHT